MRPLFAAIGAALCATIGAHAQETRTAWDYVVEDRMVEHADAAIHVRIFSQDAERTDARTIVILPSLGRGVEDYTEDYDSTLTTRFVEAGYNVALIQPRGIGRSTGDLTPVNMSMSLFAKDLKKTLDALGIQKVDLIGHAFGNRLARTYATLFPDAVDHLVLLASGGAGIDEAQRKCLIGSLNLKLTDAERLEALQCGFFAKGNDPSVWLEGWHPDLVRAQIHATRMINGDFFAKAGGKPFLLVQAGEDFIATPDKAGRPLKEALGDQVAYAEIPFASHALTSEQPDIIAALVLEYLGRD